jgi:DNA-binding NarL/FixJ family response regulator
MRKKEMSITVAIVEDDRRAREILAVWIQGAEGFQCVGQLRSVEEALDKLPVLKPLVVLMDINLPRLSGVDGVRQLKPLMPGTQFVMLTVYEDANHIFDALAAGASGYLLKHTPRLELLESLKDVHTGGSPMTSHIARKVVQAFQQGGKPGLAYPAAEKLSPREREVLELLARGYLYKEIMEALKISRPTVNSHIRNIYEKLHVHSRSQAVAKFSHFSLESPSRLPAQQ